MKDKRILTQIPKGKIQCTWSNGETEFLTPTELDKKANRAWENSHEV